jgi:ribose 5-phosphate isomerase RpiB
MRIAIGADHAGYDLKCHLVVVLQNLDHTVLDLGTHSEAGRLPGLLRRRGPGRGAR